MGSKLTMSQVYYPLHFHHIRSDVKHQSGLIHVHQEYCCCCCCCCCYPSFNKAVSLDVIEVSLCSADMHQRMFCRSKEVGKWKDWEEEDSISFTMVPGCRPAYTKHLLSCLRQPTLENVSLKPVEKGRKNERENIA